ncbi:hypothetical protein SH139x_000210 [Planctomycetaceae bacterium SH139]
MSRPSAALLAKTAPKHELQTPNAMGNCLNPQPVDLVSAHFVLLGDITPDFGGRNHLSNISLQT